MKELKLYYITDTTKDWSRNLLIKNTIMATHFLFERDFSTKEEYILQPATPKINKRVKKLVHWDRCIQDLADQNLVFVEYDGIIAIQPTYLENLPYFIQKLQLANFSEEVEEQTELQPIGESNFLVIERADSDLPAGKLVAQAGHLYTRVYASDVYAFENWNVLNQIYIIKVSNQGCVDALYQKYSTLYKTSYIIDSARTHYDKPTQTLMSIGPITNSELIEILGELDD